MIPSALKLKFNFLSAARGTDFPLEYWQQVRNLHSKLNCFENSPSTQKQERLPFVRTQSRSPLSQAPPAPGCLCISHPQRQQTLQQPVGSHSACWLQNPALAQLCHWRSQLSISPDQKFWMSISHKASGLAYLLYDCPLQRHEEWKPPVMFGISWMPQLLDLNRVLLSSSSKAFLYGPTGTWQGTKCELSLILFSEYWSETVSMSQMKLIVKIIQILPPAAPVNSQSRFPLSPRAPFPIALIAFLKDSGKGP